MQDKPYVVLVGIDFSEVADRALQEGLTLASWRPNSELHVLSIVPAPKVDPRYSIPVHAVLDGESVLEGPMLRLRAHVELQLERFGMTHAGARYPNRVVSHVSIAAPAQGIAQLAAELEADLIVLGTHQRRGVERLLLGSVAEGTVRHAPCPVLVVPAPEPTEAVKFDAPCPACVEVRVASEGKQLWCEQHRERHGRRHTYHEPDRSGSSANFPLVFR